MDFDGLEKMPALQYAIQWSASGQLVTINPLHEAVVTFRKLVLRVVHAAKFVVEGG